MIGGYVLRELVRGKHDVTSYARRPPRVKGAQALIGDITNLPHLKESFTGYDAVVHLSAVTAPGRATPEELMYMNVIGTTNVLEAAVAAKVKTFVFASSGAANGFSFQNREIIPRYLPVDEDHPAEPVDEYGLSKLFGELTCKRYSTAFGIRTICIRINHAWYNDRAGAEMVVKSGAWTKGWTVEDFWTRRYRYCLLDPDSERPIPGPPLPRYLLWAVGDARDVAQSFRLAVENETLLHEVFAINCDDTCSLTPTRELVARYFPDVPLRPLPDGDFPTLVSCDKAKRLLGYRAEHSWRDSDFGDWFRKNFPEHAERVGAVRA
jgi:nucleoside-diphosphate-sugar epimerase